VKTARTSALDIAYEESGPADGRPVVLVSWCESRFSLSRRPVHARCVPRRRLIRPYHEYALRRLDLVTGAPPRDEGAREGGVEEVDRHRVIENPT
jgi:hypothetical protein